MLFSHFVFHSQNKAYRRRKKVFHIYTCNRVNPFPLGVITTLLNDKHFCSLETTQIAKNISNVFKSNILSLYAQTSCLNRRTGCLKVWHLS